MRGMSRALLLLLVVIAAAAASAAAFALHRRQPAGPEPAGLGPSYTAVYNYTISAYLGDVRLGTALNEFRIQVVSVDGDLIRFYYEPLISYNSSVANPRKTLNYSYALIPSNLTTYYAGFGMPLFISPSVGTGSGGGNATVGGYRAEYKYLAMRANGSVLVSATIAIYNGSDLVSIQYWYYDYNATTSALRDATGLLLTPVYSYRFEYQLVSSGVSRAGRARAQGGGPDYALRDEGGAREGGAGRDVRRG
jgi:hypothetical protein